MFLFLLVIFPLISYFIFNYFKNDINQVNGAVKLILVFGIFIITVLMDTKILDKGSYMSLLVLWYVLVFIYFYYQYIKILNKNIDKLSFPKFNFGNFVLGFFYIIIIFIFYITLWDDYEVKEKLEIFSYDSKGIVNIFFLFLAFIILFGLFYKIMDSIKNLVFSRIIEKKKFKEQLKKEILEELRK